LKSTNSYSLYYLVSYIFSILATSAIETIK